MSARNRMTMRAVVERSTPAGLDEWGQATVDVWATYLAALACWYWQVAEREVVAEKAAVVGDMRLMVPRGTAITEADRINGVTDRRGTTIRSGLLLIENVIRRQDHLELTLRGVGA